ncbi:hypothetical protein Glove_300g121 [Diversispora epigaea]|uniref:Serine-threonine/tyrosine-protein kinase catalytic domain-containing protein n=1 Tax=Diversispora epigaea TaxID=1348612 RepID=A0A397HWJ6_9GLOM|nr:hypothetical protein Glove_300g121 [Diversispora epigaea]
MKLKDIENWKFMIVFLNSMTSSLSKSSDIFGLGIILWEISSIEMESSSNVDLLNNIAKGKREVAIPGTPYKCKEIYTDCWNHNGNSRPDISQVVENHYP